MNNRITGDFNSDSIEAFRAAYAASMSNPEEHDIDPIAQIPSNVISNTSPWIEHTGLWKANDGMSRDFKPNQPFNPNDYFPEDEEENTLQPNEESEEVENDEVEFEGEYEPLTEDEFNSLSEEIWGEDEGEYEGEDRDAYDENYEDEDEDEEDSLNEEEIEELINEILGSDSDYDEDEDEDGGDYQD